MPFYAKPISQLETPDLQELLDEHAVENVRLEFTRKEETKLETLKKLSSFANTFGGYLIVGGEADSKDGRLQGLSGVDTIPGYGQKVLAWCFQGASPPITAEVSGPIPAVGATGKFCYVIYTSESDVAPHFLNNRNGVWVRTGEYSAAFKPELANDVELRHLFDRRQLIRDRRTNLLARAKGRFQTYLGQRFRDLAGNKTDTGPLLELSVIPRFPSRPLCDQSALQDCVKRTQMAWRSVGFPNIRGDILTQHESVIVLEPATSGTSFFEANIWGGLFYAATLKSETAEASGIHTHRFAGLVLVFLHHATKLLGGLGYSGPLLIEPAIGPVLNVPWLHGMHGYPVQAGGSPLDTDITFALQTSAETLRGELDAVAMDIFRPIFFAVNWRALTEDYEPNTILRLGYEYNRWKAAAY